MQPLQLIPVAEYVRMSTEDQKYSIPNQQAAIRQYAALHGFSICRTYADPGKSGVLLKHRKGLAQLLQEVVSGEAKYKAVLVYDVSRWGRFQNPDEAAYYDFICANAGIKVHYCAEQFGNDGSVSSMLLKAIKRTMAGEFSRELGIKVFDGLKRLVEQGFHAGALAPYGLERMLISASGKRKRVLKRGEQKNIKSDKIVLARGRPSEVECVRRIFSMCAYERKTCVQIASALNANRLTFRGNPWNCDRVLHVLRRPQYLGLNVWARRTQKMYGPSTRQPSSRWVMSKAPFTPIVEQATFDRAQQTLASHRVVAATRDELVSSLKRLLARKGRLSCTLLDEGRAFRRTGTYIRQFGSVRKAYELVGWKLPPYRHAAAEHSHSHKHLHARVLEQIHGLFPSDVRLIRLTKRGNQIVEIDGGIRVSILLCGKRSRPGAQGRSPWQVRFNLQDQSLFTLICLLDSEWKDVLSYHLFLPARDKHGKSHCFYENDPWIVRGGIRLENLGQLCQAVRKQASEHSSIRS